MNTPAPKYPTYIAASGDTKYEQIAVAGKFAAIVRVSVLWPSGWHVSNERASFDTRHIAEMVNDGRWTVEA